MGDKTDRATGKLKRAAGAAKGDAGMQAEGKREEMKGDLKQAGKKVKDAAGKL
jgi:uncharacterized protein YjbJ (UPF0337 family)